MLHNLPFVEKSVYLCHFCQVAGVSCIRAHLLNRQQQTSTTRVPLSLNASLCDKSMTAGWLRVLVANIQHYTSQSCTLYSDMYVKFIIRIYNSQHTKKIHSQRQHTRFTSKTFLSINASDMHIFIPYN